MSRQLVVGAVALALGFGIKEKSDIDFLKGKADIAVIGSQTIRILERHGIAAYFYFMSSDNEPKSAGYDPSRTEYQS